MLEEKLKSLPGKSGVYLMKNENGKIVYVGKALNLKSRVRSYFSSAHAQSPKTQALVRNIADLEYIVTDTEVEALILENNLIKEHKPKYNIRLTDDKNYPYIKVTLNENFPRLEVVRSVKKDGARYFGPYTSAGAVHETLRLIKKIFPIRACKHKDFANIKRPCLNAHIRRCQAPCVGGISRAEYREMIQEVILFLAGKQEDLQLVLKEKMAEASAKLQFEKAAEIRDQLLAVEKIIAKQKIVLEKLLDLDVIHYARSFTEVCVQVFFIRGGKVMGRDHFFLQGSQEREGREILSAFIKQYYNQAEIIPPEILLPEEVEDYPTLETWLSEKRGARVSLKIPKQREKYQLLQMAGQNAQESLQQEIVGKFEKKKANQDALEELVHALGLTKTPRRMECYDISHIQGLDTVASMVVFEDGQPKPAYYRRFRIKTVEGIDDFASMAEVIRRRLTKAKAGDEKFAELPDLIIIDGGKGQLSAARKVMDELGFGTIETVGLAKKEEWVYVEKRKEPFILPRQAKALHLLQRIRDEAHRFALNYHRLLRGKRHIRSALDEISGVGPQRKNALLKHFGYSLEKITKATVEELTEIEGIPASVAREIWDFFHPAQI